MPGVLRPIALSDPADRIGSHPQELEQSPVHGSGSQSPMYAACSGLKGLINDGAVVDLLRR